MKDEPAFKPLQRNPTLFLVRESRYPLKLKAAKSGSLSHTYCSRKAPLEVLVEIWPTCSKESWESAFLSRRYGLNRDFLELRQEPGVYSRLKEVKPLLVSDGEQGIALEPIPGNSG